MVLAEMDAGRRDGLRTAEREELTHLRNKVRASRQERDILQVPRLFR